MSKRNKIIYWIATVWLALGMVSTGVVQIAQQPEELKNFANLGYPAYLAIIIGAWKLLGTVAVLVPRFPLVKEWAYAGFFFAMTGAIVSHMVTDMAWDKIIPALLLLTLTIVSWAFRPPGRKFN